MSSKKKVQEREEFKEYLSITDKIAWKCTSCGKAYRVKLSYLQKIQEKKNSNGAASLLRCKECGVPLDNGNEKIFWKCSCGNVQSKKLQEYSIKEGIINKNKLQIDKKNKAQKNIMKYLLCFIGGICISLFTVFIIMYGKNWKKQNSREYAKKIEEVNKSVKNNEEEEIQKSNSNISGKEEEDEKNDYPTEKIIRYIINYADQISEKTISVHINPEFVPINSHKYYLFETTDEYIKNKTTSGKPCEVKVRLLHSRKHKFVEFDFYLDLLRSLNYDVMKIKISDGIEELVIEQQNINCEWYSLYIPYLDSENILVDDLKSKAEKMCTIAKSKNKVKVSIEGVKKQECIVLTRKQKESLLYIAEVWRNILEFY